MKSDWLVIETDTHGGHRQGLLNPDTTLYDEGEEGELVEYSPGMTATQKYLWKLRKHNLAQVAKLNSFSYFHLGDQTQGKRYVSEWVGTRESDQIEIAYMNAKPIMDMPNIKTARFAMGTASHEFGEGTAPILLQKRYKAEHRGLDVKTVSHGLCEVAGVSVDYAHHGPYPGSRSWLKGNVARYYLRDRMMAELMSGNEPADLYLRGHYHEMVWETVRINTRGRWFQSTLLILPSMCGLGVYARQSTRSTPKLSNGMVLVQILYNKIIDVHWLVKTLDIRTKEVLS